MSWKSPLLLPVILLVTTVTCGEHDPAAGDERPSSTNTTASISTSGADASTDTTSGFLTASSETTLGGTSTGGSECGNRVVEPGEHCDGLPLAGTECPPDCAFAPGTILWELTFDGDGAADYVSSLAVDPDGTIFVGGTSYPGSRTLLLRVSASGELDDSAFYSQFYGAYGITVDSDRLLALNSTPGPDFVLAAFTPFLDLSWDTTYELDHPDSAAIGHNLAIADRHVVVFASDEVGGVAPGLILTFDGASLIDELDVAGPPIDESGELSQFGAFFGTFLGSQTVILSGNAATATGGQAWMQRRTLPGDVEWEILMDAPIEAGLEGFSAAETTPEGDIVVTRWGYIESAAEYYDVWVGKFSPIGDLLWSDVYAGEPHRADTPEGLAVDAEGRIFVHVTRSDDEQPQPQDDYDMVLLSYDADGERRWTDVFSSPGVDGAYSWDYASDVVAHPDGFVVVCGRVMTESSDYDIILRAVAP